MSNIKPLGINTLTGKYNSIESTDILIINGGQRIKRTPVDADYTILPTDYYIGVTQTDVPKVITLPLAVDVGSGGICVVKDESGGANVNNISVTPDVGNLVEGDIVFLLDISFASATFVSDGIASWFVI